MIIFSSETEYSTEMEPFHRNSPVQKKDSYENASVEKEVSLKNVHIIITWKFLKASV